MVESVNYAPWFFIAGVVGLGAVATDSGLGSSVGQLMLAELDLSSGGIWRNYAVITAMSVVVGLITTIGALPAVMTPLAQSIAEATGWNVNSVLMAQVPAYLFYLLPYQVPPVILTISMAGLAMSPVVRFLALHFVLGMVIIVPLHFHWAAFLGYLP
ncbi:MAG: hypothetical protein E4H01_06490 [Lysobacterales bacterium]|nr:MAG: hypothetical protein E4H01_06490 [Xanthomonadales bacterium]